MASPLPSGRRGSRLVKKSASPPLEHDRTRLSRELEEIRQRELASKKELEEIQKKMADLPRRIEEKQRKDREMIKMRAIATPTALDAFSSPRDKRHAPSRPTTSRRMTRPEERSARLQLLVLCGILAVFFFFLCKSLPH